MNNKRGRGGFTLVELIVVLVILAILAALLIPALTGYIDKSKKRQVIAETRMLHQAIQTELSDFYGSSNWSPFIKNGETGSATPSKLYLADKNGTASQKEYYNQILKLAELSTLDASSSSASFGAFFTEDGKAAVIIYDNGKGNVGIYFGDTGETLAYDKSDFNSFDSYYTSIKGKLFYTKKDYGHGVANPLISKDFILSSSGLGYKNA